LDRLEKLVRKQRNIYRAHELVDALVRGVENGVPFQASEEVIKRIHSVAMEGLLDQPGQYRTGPVHITNSPHRPPPWIEVPGQMAGMIAYIQQHWDDRNLIHLSAFTLWRLCWIHPFPNGNGRTARAVAYLVLCARNGRLFSPKNTVIEQIQANKMPYYQTLRMADDQYAQFGNVDEALRPMEELMSDLLKEQIRAALPFH
jgi:Fic family protein